MSQEVKGSAIEVEKEEKKKEKKDKKEKKENELRQKKLRKEEGEGIRSRKEGRTRYNKQ